MEKKLSQDKEIEIVRKFLKSNGFEVTDILKRISGIESELRGIQCKLDFLRSSLLTKKDRLKSLKEINKIIGVH